MANFKVGQRVRIIGTDNPKFRHLIGTETVIVEGPFDWFGQIAYRTRCSVELDELGHADYNLAPLTDPKAQEFIERMNRLGRAPQPERVCEFTTGECK